MVVGGEKPGRGREEKLIKETRHPVWRDLPANVKTLAFGCGTTETPILDRTMRYSTLSRRKTVSRLCRKERARDTKQIKTRRCDAFFRFPTPTTALGMISCKREERFCCIQTYWDRSLLSRGFQTRRKERRKRAPPCVKWLSPLPQTTLLALRRKSKSDRSKLECITQSPV